MHVKSRIRFFALPRIKPHAPPLVRAPVNSFEFQPCDHTPQAEYLKLSLREEDLAILPTSTHSLRPGLPGYLIPFAPLAFVPQRQTRSSVSLSPPAFLPISTHFTAPLEVPHTPTSLQPCSLGRSSPVGPGAFTPYLQNRLRTLQAQ